MKHIKDNKCSGLPVKMLLLKVIKCSRIAWDFSTLLRLNKGHVSKLIFENNPIRNQISNDFDKWCHELQNILKLINNSLRKYKGN